MARCKCLECGEWFNQDRDLELCDKCVDLFDTEKLWQDHDNNLICAIDFNENKKLRESYRLHK